MGKLYETNAETNEWYMENVDWKQLGYMIADITDNESDVFTSTLINKGTLLNFLL